MCAYHSARVWFVTAVVTILLAAGLLALDAGAAPVTLADAGETRTDGATVWYQGFLADSSTNEPISGTYEIAVEIYDSQSGGTLLWGPEAHHSTPVARGWFNIELGSIVGSLPDFSAPPYYLQLNIQGEILSPRQKLASVPTAIRSEDDGDWFIDGADIYHESGFVNIGSGPLGEDRDGRVSGLNVAGTAMVTGFRMPTGATAGRVLTSDASGNGSWQTAAGTIGGGGTGDYIPKFTTATTLGNSALYEISGRIGLGTTSPLARLSVVRSSTERGLEVLTSTSSSEPVMCIEKTNAAAVSDKMLSIRVGGAPLTGADFLECLVGGQLKLKIDCNGYIYSQGAGISLDHGDMYVHSNSGPAIECSSGAETSDARGVLAECTGFGSFDAVAVEGTSVPHDFYGVGGSFTGGWYGVEGTVNPTGGSWYVGLRGTVNGGSGTNYGAYGGATGTGTNYGVFGVASGGSANWAGYFEGNVRVTGSLVNPTAGMEIDDPSDPANRYLRHANVLSSEMKTVYDGTVTLDGAGEAWVEMPEWFEVLNGDFRYQLTAIGAPGPDLYIAEKITAGRFRIAGGRPGMEVSWQVTGVRHDPVALERRTEVVQEKPNGEAGKYLNPEAYGMARTAAVGYVEEKADR